jgi:hypothetical protein
MLLEKAINETNKCRKARGEMEQVAAICLLWCMWSRNYCKSFDVHKVISARARIKGHPRLKVVAAACAAVVKQSIWPHLSPNP